MNADLIWMGLIFAAVVALAVWHGKRPQRPGRHRHGSAPWAGDWGHSDRSGGDSGANGDGDGGGDGDY